MFAPAMLEYQLESAEARRINNDLANDAVNAVEVISTAYTIATGVFQYDNTGPDDVADHGLAHHLAAPAR